MTKKLVREARQLAGDLALGHYSMAEATAMIRKLATALEKTQGEVAARTRYQPRTKRTA